MSSTRLYRDQHQELSLLIAGLRSHLGTPSGKGFLAAFSAFAEKLKTHLALEDRGLYPLLLVHENEQVQLTARIYQAEMGALGRDFEALERRWTSQKEGAEVPPALARGIEELLGRLEQRMSREDRGLYALVDRLE